MSVIVPVNVSSSEVRVLFAISKSCHRCSENQHRVITSHVQERKPRRVDSPRCLKWEIRISETGQANLTCVVARTAREERAGHIHVRGQACSCRHTWDLPLVLPLCQEPPGSAPGSAPLSAERIWLRQVPSPF